ncbi:MAG: hypothetical protein R2715_02260 [Ilumatobacteraceae bacterium]
MDHAGNGTDGSPEPLTYLLLDGENIDATLGNSVLGRRPNPEERPRWERVLEFTEHVWGHRVRALFFMNASGHVPMGFVQALQAMGLRPVLLSGPSHVKVVDVGIQRTLDALVERPGNVLLGSHDGDFLPQIEALLGTERRVGMLSFREFLNSAYPDLVGKGLEIFDLETDAKCFNFVLPRTRVIDIADFDPAVFLAP